MQRTDSIRRDIMDLKAEKAKIEAEQQELLKQRQQILAQAQQLQAQDQKLIDQTVELQGALKLLDTLISREEADVRGRIETGAIGDTPDDILRPNRDKKLNPRGRR